jgi:hypothetical protein
MNPVLPVSGICALILNAVSDTKLQAKRQMDSVVALPPCYKPLPFWLK